MTDKAAALDAALAQIDRAFGKAGTGERPPLPREMTERVARELCRQRLLVEEREIAPDALAQLIDAHWRTFIDRARSLFAVMSVPTKEMLDTAEGWQPKDDYQNLETARERIAFLWDVMMTDAEYEYDEEGNSQLEKREREHAAWNALSKEEQDAHWADWEAKNAPNGLPF